MSKPLMPQATAVWLVENTGLSFLQIGTFCGLHELEVQAIADEEVAVGMQGIDPVINGQLTHDEIARCEGDPASRLEMAKSDIPQPVARPKGPRYTPLSRRQEKPDAIAWILRHHPELSDAQIGRLIGTTKPTINAVRDRTHRNMPNLRPRSPVELGLCGHDDLAQAIEKGLKAGRQPRLIDTLPEESTEAMADPFGDP